MKSIALTLCISLMFATPILSSVAQASKSEISKKQSRLKLARKEYKKGLEHFEASQYEEALTCFLRVYRIEQNPILVYNMARSFEALKRYEDAASHYEEYLKLDPKASDRGSVSLTIKTLRALGTPPTASADSSVSSSTEEAQELKDRREATSNRTIWGWSALGTGSALLIGGALMGVEAMNQSETLDQERDFDRWKVLYDERETSALWADGLYVGGAALIGVGIYFLLSSDSNQDRSTAEAATLPIITVGPLSVSAAFTF